MKIKTCRMCCLPHEGVGEYCTRSLCSSLRAQAELLAREKSQGRYIVQFETYDAKIESEPFANWGEAFDKLDNIADNCVSAFILDTETGESFEPRDIRNSEGM